MDIATDNDTTLLVLGLIADGKRLHDAAHLTGVNPGAVRHIAREYGYPNMDQIRTALEGIKKDPRFPGLARVPESESAQTCHERQPDSAQDILLRAAGSDQHRTRQLAAKAQALVSDLRKRLEAEAAAAAADAELERQREKIRTDIAELEAKLMAAREQLKGTLEPAAGGEPSAKTIRTWTAENGIPCSARGRIDKETREAYYAAHSTVAA